MKLCDAFILEINKQFKLIQAIKKSIESYNRRMNIGIRIEKMKLIMHNWLKTIL